MPTIKWSLMCPLVAMVTATTGGWVLKECDEVRVLGGLNNCVKTRWNGPGLCREVVL